MQKKIIILKSAPGARLANQLWNFISIYAYCLEKGYRCENWSFFEEKKQKHENNHYNLYNYYKFFNIPASFFTKIIILAHLIVAKICKRARLHDRFSLLIKRRHPLQIISSDKEKTFYLSPTNNQNPAQTAQLAIAEKSSKIYFNGWLFRNPIGIEKYRQEIKKYFQPKKETIRAVEKFLSPLRQKYENIIGVHVRQTDYRYFLNGKLLLEPKEIKEFFEHYLEFAEKERDKTLFIICSDGKIDEFLFPDLNIKQGSGKIMEDLYLLSQTSIIIGSNSTFGAFAAYYGNIPIIVFQRDKIDWNYYKNKKKYFENKYITMVNF